MFEVEGLFMDQSKSVFPLTNIKCRYITVSHVNNSLGFRIPLGYILFVYVMFGDMLQFWPTQSSRLDQFIIHTVVNLSDETKMQLFTINIRDLFYLWRCLQT